MSYIHLLPTVCNCMHTFEVFVMWDVERIKQLWGRIICLMSIDKLHFSFFSERPVLTVLPPEGFLVNLTPDVVCDSTFFWHIWWVKLNQVRGIYRPRLISGLSECYLAHLNLLSFVPTKPSIKAWKYTYGQQQNVMN